MWGGDDPDDRMPMVWADLSFDDQTRMPLGQHRTADPVAFDPDLHSFYRILTGLRAEQPALRHGTFEAVLSPEADRAIAFVRRGEDESVLVVINREERAVEAPIESSAFDLTIGVQPSVTSRDEPFTIVRQDERGVVLELPPLAGAIYVN
jgi:glycosidase